MNQVLKGMILGAFGGFTGTFIALELAPYFWWIGALVGFAIGYFSYGFRTILRGAERASKAAVAAWDNVWKGFTGWRPDKTYWKFLFWSFLFLLPYAPLPLAPFIIGDFTSEGIGFLIYGVFSLAIAIFALLHLFSEEDNSEEKFIVTLTLSLFFPLLILCIIMPFVIAKDENFRDKNIAEAKECAIRWNPIALLFFQLPRGVFLGSPWLLRNAPRIARSGIMAIFTAGKASWRFAKVFFWTLFRFIHSEKRLAQGIYFALATCVGYAFGSVLVGAAAGALFDLLGVQFVRNWVLKLAPARSETS